MENQTKETALRVQVKEETDTKIVLEWTGVPLKWSDNIGCISPLFIVAVVLALGFVWALRFFSDGAFSWLLWVIAILFVVLEFFVLRETFKLLSTKDNVLEETLTIDLDSRLATRVQKLQSGSIKQSELDLNRVRQVLVNMEEVGHHYRLSLESQHGDFFQVSISFADGSSYSSDELTKHGRKIGRHLNVPVVLKHTDMGNLIEKYRIQG